MTIIFKTFEEAKDYIQKDPVGKSIVRLDGGSGYKVRIKSNHNQYDNSFDDYDEEVDNSSYEKELREVIGRDFIHRVKYESKEDSFENKYKKVARDLKSSYRKKKEHIRKATEISDARAKVVRPTQNDHKRYINETWGSRSEWKTMSGRQSAINKSNKG